MNKFKLVSLMACLILCLVLFSGLISQQAAMAKSEQVNGASLISSEQASPPEEKIELSTKYPAVSGPADTVFKFEVDLNYVGEETRYFEFSLEKPTDWLALVQKSAYAEEQIPGLNLEPTIYTPEKVVVVVIAPFWLYPEPGEYTIRLEAAAEEIKGSIDLTARITARYGFSVETATGRLNIKATSGKESYLPITITNTGTATLDKVTFYSSKPSGIAGEEWSVTFKPDKIESLSPGDNREVEVTIKPPSKTIAGDYMTTLRFNSDPKPSTELPKLEIRVAVGTSTKWGLIAVGIVVAVIAGLVVGFRQLGRR